MTTAHLPECLFHVYKDFGYCICDRLRACEERVRKAERNKNKPPSLPPTTGRALKY